MKRSLLYVVICSILLTLPFSLRADNTAQTLPFSQNWTNVALITITNDWSSVPGITGYRGDDLTTATGTDPQTIIADGTATPVSVLANQLSPNANTQGAVAEFEIANPAIALQGSGTADAPFILISLNTTAWTNVNVAYNIRDIDGSTDNAIQPVALQYRVGSSGNFTNLPLGFVSDATTGPSLATLVTPVSVELPADAAGRSLVQVRVITTNAVGSDEWVAIDDISITGTPGPVSTNPAGTGQASPATVESGSDTLLTVTVVPGTNPASTALQVTADLTSIGGAASQPFLDNGLGGDVTAGDNIFSRLQTVSPATLSGAKSLPFTILDAEGRSGNGSISLTVVDPPPPPPPGQPLPFSQDWNNTSLITTDGNWSGVPGIVGHRGDDLVAATGVDPQTIVTDGSGTPINVEANETNPSSFTTGGVAEFHLSNPTIALNGSGTADAPHIILNVDTTGHSGIAVAYAVRDLDGSIDNAVQPVALQYRVGNAGNYVNIPAGFIADATDGPSVNTRVTPVAVMLPPDADNRPLVQIRIITANAVGNDEWVGIDDIHVFDADASTPPTGVGSATPSTVDIGSASLLTVAVTPGANPTSFTHFVTMDLSLIGGSNPQAFFDDGVNGGDAAAGDNVFSFTATVANGTPPGIKVLPGTVSDTFNRSSLTSITLTAIAPPPILAIHEIQGGGQFSPVASQLVTTTGVVTALKFNGFYIQAPDALGDGNPQTSEGIFVFTSSAPPAAAAVGNFVRVTGGVQEFIPTADPFQLPLTEITSPTVLILTTGEPLPAPVVLTAGDTSPAGPLDQLERYEGMRVQVNSLLITAGTGGNVSESNATATSDGVFYGVVPPNPRPFREPGVHVFDPLPPGSPATVQRFDGNPELIRVDSDALLGAPRVDVTATEITGPIVGPLDYGFRAYTILPEPGLPIVINETVLPTPVSTPTGSQFTVAAYNLERFFDTNNNPAIGEPVLSTTAFNNRLNKVSLAIRNILQTPDLLAVEEVEDLATLQMVAAKVNNDAVASGQPNPNYAAYLEEGNDVGGIDVGFLVKSSRVTVVDVTQVGKDATYTFNGQTALLNDRPPLMLEAVVTSDTGRTFPITVIANHLRSLLGLEDPVDGPRVRAKRAAQAEFLANFIQDRQEANADERIISVGDYNAFQFSDGYVDSIGTIQGTPTPADQVVLASTDLVNPDLINLIETVPFDQRYSYVFDGNAQAIDHGLITQNLFPHVDKLQFGRLGADFAEAARNDPNAPTRLSDHDPLVVFFNFPPPAATQTMLISSQNPSTFGEPITFTATVTAGGAPVSQGTVTFFDGPSVLAGPFTLTPGGTASFTSSTLTPGTHPITAAFSGTGDFSPSAATVTQVIVQPRLTIDDVAVVEGDSGTRAAVFTVTLSPPSEKIVTVDFTTAGGTATSGSDFVAQAATLTFAPGMLTQTITVTVISDVLNEVDENFFVNLSNPLRAVIDDDQGVGTIMDDDDDDGDGVADVSDACPATPAGAIVNSAGCSIAQLCSPTAAWRNHGAYVSCVSNAADAFFAAGLITSEQQEEITTAAAHSSIGKKK